MKRIFLIAIVGIVMGLGYWWLTTRPAPESVGPLSARSQEFIRTQKQRGDTLWNEVSLATVSPAVLGTATVSMSCFALDLPWPVIEIRREERDGTCVFRARVPSNGLQLTLKHEPYQGSLADYPGYLARQRDPAQYVRETTALTLSGETAIFYDGEASVLFWLDAGVMRTIALTSSQQQLRERATLVRIATSL